MFTSQNSINKEQKDVIFPSGISVFAQDQVDIETNPGPKKQSCLKFFHRNLNGLASHDFIKLLLTEEYIATSNFDVVCLSENFDSGISNDDNRINVARYSMIRADHLSNMKKGGV